jgi:hypothetical protein
MRAFSLVEMVAVIAILVTLMTAGIALMSGTGVQSRKAGVDLLSGLIEQARTTAVVSRCHVVLAIAEPQDFPNSDNQCRLGLFKVAAWPDPLTGSLDATQMSRWQNLNSGIVLLAGKPIGSDGKEIDLGNPLSESQITVKYGAKTVEAHVIAFTPRGGLQYPVDSKPIVLRIAEGSYRGSPAKATANLRSGQTKPTETVLKIGRVTARPYHLD